MEIRHKNVKNALKMQKCKGKKARHYMFKYIKIDMEG